MFLIIGGVHLKQQEKSSSADAWWLTKYDKTWIDIVDTNPRPGLSFIDPGQDAE